MSRSLRPRITSLLIGTTVSALLLLVGVFAFRVTSSQVHAAGSTLFVGHSIGSDTDCTSPGFTSVQTAVDASTAGDTVYLCGITPFSEQVIITKAITLTGDNGATIQAPNPFPATPLSRLPSQFTTDSLFVPQAIVIVWGAGSNATITNLTIAGVLPGNGGCAEQEFGVLVIAGGTAALSGDQVRDIRDSNPALYGCQFGTGIQVGRRYWPTANFSTFLVENFVGHATVMSTTVSGYQKNGITIDGPGSTTDVRGNTVIGAGRGNSLSLIIAQNGIQVSRGASAQVRDNSVTGNSYTGPSFASSGGILIFGGCGDPLVTGVQVMGNTLINNDVGIYLNNFTDDCSAAATAMTNDKAVNNTISNDMVSNVGDGTSSGFPYKGYQAGIDDIGNNDKIIHNTISGAGYTPAQTTPGGPFVMPIDTSSFSTTSPKVHANVIR